MFLFSKTKKSSRPRPIIITTSAVTVQDGLSSDWRRDWADKNSLWEEVEQIPSKPGRKSPTLRRASSEYPPTLRPPPGLPYDNRPRKDSAPTLGSGRSIEPGDLAHILYPTLSPIPFTTRTRLEPTSSSPNTYRTFQPRPEDFVAPSFHRQKLGNTLNIPKTVEYPTFMDWTPIGLKQPERGDIEPHARISTRTTRLPGGKQSHDSADGHPSPSSRHNDSRHAVSGKKLDFITRTFSAHLSASSVTHTDRRPSGDLTKLGLPLRGHSPSMQSSKLERLLGMPSSDSLNPTSAHPRTRSSNHGHEAEWVRRESSDVIDIFPSSQPRPNAIYATSSNVDPQRHGSFIDLDEPPGVSLFVIGEDEVPHTARSDDSEIPTFAKRRPESVQHLHPSSRRTAVGVMGGISATLADYSFDSMPPASTSTHMGATHLAVDEEEVLSDDSEMPTFTKRRPESVQHLHPSPKHAILDTVPSTLAVHPLYAYPPASHSSNPASSPLFGRLSPIVRSASATVYRTPNEHDSSNPPDRPPTTNTLDPNQRTELVRKTRKLAQMFGVPPDIDMVHPAVGSPGPLQEVSPTSSRQNTQHRASRSDEFSPLSPSAGREAFDHDAQDPVSTYQIHFNPSWSVFGQNNQNTSPHGKQPGTQSKAISRRHSTPPTSPLEFTSYLFARDQVAQSINRLSRSDSELAEYNQTGRGGGLHPNSSPKSPVSFIDLSDEEEAKPDGRTHRYPIKGEDQSGPTTPETPLARAPYPTLGTIQTHTSDMNGWLYQHRLPPHLQYPGASPIRENIRKDSLADSLASSSISHYSNEDSNYDIVVEDKRKNREKMGKLHRYLGSRIPPELVLGPSSANYAQDLPVLDNPLSPRITSANYAQDLPVLDNPLSPRDYVISALSGSTKGKEKEKRPDIMTRRRSSSAVAYGPSRDLLSGRDWSRRDSDPQNERVKAQLSDGEKMINVKRALKMEKMFGAQPPQRLYHTRPPTPTHEETILQSNTLDRNTSLSAFQQIASNFSILHPGWSKKSPPGTSMGHYARKPSTDTSSGSLAHLIPSYGNQSQSTLEHSDSGDETQEIPFTTEAGVREWAANNAGHSYKPPIPPKPGYSITASYPAGKRRQQQELQLPQSNQYTHYRNSLQSLNHIIDTDDRESLAELYAFVQGSSASEAEGEDVQDIDATPRRQSLPPHKPRSSFETSDSTSIVGPPSPTEFQTRRKRAAKLAHFFGVDYRHLFGEVLESLESGVREEIDQGSLSFAEMQELLDRLDVLKRRRDQMAS